MLAFMSVTVRNTLTITLTILMAVFFFMAGYLLNDYVDEQSRQPRPLPVQNAAVQTDMPDDTAVSRTPLADGDLALFWEAWDKIETNFIGELPDSTAVNYAAIRGTLDQLDDPYTIFLEPVVREEERQSLRGSFGGIGANLARNAAGQVELSPIAGNPAEKAGVLLGDILLAVDGKSVAADEPVSAIAERIKGEKGTAVILTIERTSLSAPIDISIERGDILIPSVSSRLLREDATIGYIQLTRFSAESGAEVAAAIETLQAEGATRYILDLRNNGGGLLDAAVSVSDHFLADSVVYYQMTRREGDRTETTTAATLLPDEPLVVLVNGGTASAAEIVAGALRGHDRATLLGEQTFGKGSVQLVYDLSDGSSVHVTWARWLTPDQLEIDQNGLLPDIEVRPSSEGLADGRDEPLERAVQFLNTGN